MFSKKTTCHFFAGLLSVVGFTGCGMLGQKEDLKRTISLNNGTRCLSAFGPQSTRYLNGEIDEAEWSGTWDCTKKSVTLFEQFVKGADPTGYTRFDIKSLVKSFILRDDDVTDELIDATFQLKASILGGSTEIITYEELTKAIALLDVMQTESTYLLRFIRARYQNPRASTYLELGDAVSRFSERIATEFGRGGTEPLKLTTALTLLHEIKKIAKLDIDDGLVEFAFAAKRMVFAGDSETIQGPVWGELVRAAGTVGGAYIALDAFLTQKDDKGLRADDFFLREELALRVKEIFTKALDRHSGVIKFDVLDEMIDRMPDEWLSIKGENGLTKVMNRLVVKTALKPLFQKGLAGSSEGITGATTELVYELYVAWSKGDRYLRKVYEAYNLDPVMGESRENVRAALEMYRKTLPRVEWSYIDRLVGFLKSERDGGYRSMYRGQDSQIVFDTNPLLPLAALQRLHWTNMLVKQGIWAYGHRPARTALDLEDLKELLVDFRYLCEEVNFIDTDIKDLEKKRFQEADLFMYSGNGNGVLDEKELTYYLNFLLSIRDLSASMLGALKKESETDPSCLAGGSDKLMWPKFTMKCFNKVYQGNLASFWTSLPQMYKYFAKLQETDPGAAQEIIASMEKAARFDVKLNWVASYDIQGYAGVLHFVEGMFTRFDADENQILDVDETMTAYPTFRLAFLSIKQMKEGQLRAAFAYTVKHGRPPDAKFPKVIDFVAFWWLGKAIGGWKINAPRLHLYRIIPLIQGDNATATATPEATPSTTLLGNSPLADIFRSLPDLETL